MKITQGVSQRIASPYSSASSTKLQNQCGIWVVSTPHFRQGVFVGRRSGVILRIVSGADKKKHLIEAAPVGRLDQMLRTIIQGGVWGGFGPPAKNRGVWGAARPKPKHFVNFQKNWGIKYLWDKVLRPVENTCRQYFRHVGRTKTLSQLSKSETSWAATVTKLIQKICVNYSSFHIEKYGS